MQLVIPLSKNGGPLFRQVYQGLRAAILSGTFLSGEKLPSTRDVAEQLGISRTAVLQAYDQLLATYLPQAVYIVPKLLARHLGLPEKDLVAALDRLVSDRQVTSSPLPGYPGVCYLMPGD